MIDSSSEEPRTPVLLSLSLVESPSPTTSASSARANDENPCSESREEGQEEEEGQKQQSSSSAAAMLDYFARLRLHPARVISYAGRILNASAELPSAFNPLRSGTSTPSALSSSLLPPSALPSGSHPESKQQQQQQQPAAESLVDAERSLFRQGGWGAWWSSGSGSVTPSAIQGQGQEGDGLGLEIDLSSAFSSSEEPTSSSSDPNNDNDNDNEFTSKGTAKFLRHYDPHELTECFRKHGMILRLHQMGFHHPSLIVDTTDATQHRLSVVDPRLLDPALGLRSSERFLIDVYMQRRRNWGTDQMVCYQLLKRLVKAGSWDKLREMTGEIRPPFTGLKGAKESIAFFEGEFRKWMKGAKRGRGEWEVSEIAWMQMHNPLLPVTRPLLPGQRFPGLGLGKEIAELMRTLALSSPVTDALLNAPFHFHNSTTYSLIGYKALDPTYGAYVSWMEQQLKPATAQHGFCFVSWAVTLGHLRRIVEVQGEDGSWTELSSSMERWSSSEQLYPTSSAMEGLLSSTEYTRLYSQHLALLEVDGGANLDGVKEPEHAGERRRARLEILLSACPELWKYSADPEWRDKPTGG